MRLSFVLSFISLFFYSIYAFAEDYLCKKIEIEGLKSLPKNEVIYLLGIKEGEVFKVEDATKGIKRIFLKDIFDDIVITYDEGLLKVLVKEKPIINEIKVVGNQYFPESFYKKIFPIKKGDRLKESELVNSLVLIRKKLNEKGFVNFDINVNKFITDGFFSLELHVQENSPLIIKDIKWEGDVDDFIKSFFKIDIGHIYDQEVINDYIRNLKKSFERKGYVGSEIGYRFEQNTLILNIKRGKILNIEILGETSLNEDLKKIILAHLKEKVDDNTIKNSINSLIFFYYGKGFKHVNIIPLLESTENEWKITYLINEGKRDYIKEINISTKFSEEIKNLLINKEGQPINYNELERDRQTIQEYLKSKGFHYAMVSSPQLFEEDQNLKIYYEVNEGKQVKIKSIKVEGVENTDEVTKILKKYESHPFYEGKIIEIKRDLRNYYLKKGYMDVNIDVNYKINDDIAEVILKIAPGQQRYFGKSIILGNKKTKTKFIYQRLLQKENQPYNPYLVDEERQTLYSTGLFSLIDIKNQLSDNTVDLIYNVEEQPAGSIEFGLGYGEYERAKAFLDFSYINLLGMNKQIFSRVELSTLEKRFYSTYVDPWIGKKLSFKTSLVFETADIKNIDTKDIIYKLRRYGISTGFEKKITETFKGELLYELNYSKTWDVVPEAVISDQDIGEILTSGFKLSLIYDSRDNPFDPEKGFLTGLVTKFTSEVFGSEINFLKSSFYINKYTKITKGLILATSLRVGNAWLYGKTKELPISERYFLGGRDTVRGYAQNTLGPKKDNQPTGGKAFLMGNIELRTYLGKNLSVVNFLDFGNLWNRVGDIEPTNLKYTTGIGLRYKTPIGPIRVDYGYKLNRQKGESYGEIHFSIGHAF